MNPDISVVIPIFNVEEYLEECLESVLSAKHNFRLQIILVDDGSQDGSSEIARRYADQYEFVEYYRKENGGLSSARNYGIQYAKGEYLIFIDSDDIIADDMLTNLYCSAEQYHSDFSFCNVMRFNSKKVWNSGLHQSVFLTLPSENPVSVHTCHSLLYDTTSWNKLIRRSFWLEHGFHFPEGLLFEDIPVMTPMHLCAERVSFVRKAGYYWRTREGDNKSITQMNNSIKNLKDRLIVLETVYRYLEEKGIGGALRAAFDRKVLNLDLIIFINEIKNNLPEEDEYVQRLQSFIETWPSKALIQDLPVDRQQKYEYLLSGEIDLLKKTLKSKSHEECLLESTEEGRYFLHLSPELYKPCTRDAKQEFLNKPIRNYIDDICFYDNRVIINTHLYHLRVNIKTWDQLKLSAFLVHNITSQTVSLPVRQYQTDYMTSSKGKTGAIHYNYDGVCFSISISEQELTACTSGDYHILMKYDHPLFSGYEMLHGATNRTKDYCKSITQYADSMFGKLSFDRADYLFFTVGSRVDAEGKTPRCTLVRAKTAVDPDRILVGSPVLPNGNTEKMLMNSGKVELVFDLCSAVPDCAVLYYVNRYSGNPQILGKLEKTSETEKSIRIDFGSKDVLPFLYDGTRELCLGETDHASLPIYIQQPVFYEYRTEDVELILYSDEHSRLYLWCSQRWNVLEATAKKRKSVYNTFRKEPINQKCILFESMWGGKYDCNPQMLYEYIDKNYPEYTCVWSLKDERMPINGDGIRVRRGSWEYYRYLATAKYLVNNVNFEDGFIKRPGQVMIETMHGTPYKSFGLDIKMEFPTKNEVWKFIRRNQNWDYLITQGKFVEENAWRMFRYKGKILRTGYPRTDAITNVSEEEKTALRKKLGLPPDKKLILYAPTWRVRNRFAFSLDFGELKERIGEQYALVVRVHYLAAKQYDLPVDGGFLFDRTTYTSIEDLYKIADILITDYSSAMFDFALTGKPMIFYTYDAEEYEQRLRGVYFDLSTEAPGPIVFDQDELTRAILNIDDEMENCAGRRDAFLSKYLTYEGTDSCRTVFEQAIQGKENTPSKKQNSKHGRFQKLWEKVWVHTVSYSITKDLPGYQARKGIKYLLKSLLR